MHQKIVVKCQNTHLVFSNFYPKIEPSMK